MSNPFHANLVTWGTALSDQPDRTCKRCSVTRVNALVEAYEKAHQQRQAAWLSRLSQLERLCRQRGFDQATRMLLPGLKDKELRALCWNVSSFLEDREVEQVLGINIG